MIDIAVYQRVLGDEIRALRKKRGLTRKQLNSRLQSDISLQTLATYELGTRGCSVTRLAEICLALDELPADLIARVHERLGGPSSHLRVDLRVVVRTGHAELEPLRRWARKKLDAGTSVIEMGFPALEEISGLCKVDPVDLIGMLRE